MLFVSSSRICLATGVTKVMAWDPGHLSFPGSNITFSGACLDSTPLSQMEPYFHCPQGQDRTSLHDLEATPHPQGVPASAHHSCSLFPLCLFFKQSRVIEMCTLNSASLRMFVFEI